MSVREQEFERQGERVRHQAEAAPALGQPTPVPREDWRSRIRDKPGLYQLYRVGVFLLGLFFVLIGFALAALPGPLTIPPVLLGLWIWSTEFRFAERFFDKFQEKGREAWAQAKRRPVTSALATGGGIVLAAVAFWAVAHFDLVARARDVLA